MKIIRLRAFSDNYIWLLRHGNQVAAVDPGDAQPVLDYLAQSGDRLGAILLTHHHPDHTGGVGTLIDRQPVPVFGPAAEGIAGVTHALSGGECVELPFPRARTQGVPATLEVIDVAGHTRGHLAYFGSSAERANYRRNILFCGDALFTLGCGRIFEGNADQMYRALQRLAALPGDTLVYCAHEYCQYNLPFALAVEPHNPALHQRADELRRLMATGQPTVPMCLEDELATNPFLRCHLPEVVSAARDHAGQRLTGAAEVFSSLREWRNHFKPA